MNAAAHRVVNAKQIFITVQFGFWSITVTEHIARTLKVLSLLLKCSPDFLVW